MSISTVKATNPRNDIAAIDLFLSGMFSGGYHYTLKVYIYERVRARNFARAWSYVQAAQAFPILIGVPFAGYLNEFMSQKAGYMFGFFCTTAASLILFLVGFHKRRISQHKHTRFGRIRFAVLS